VAAGQEATRAGMRWSVRVERMPPGAQDKPGRAMLRVDLTVTPVDEKAIKDFVVPDIKLRDRSGREWMTLTDGRTPIRDEMRVGKEEKIVAYGVVPEELAETAEVALVHSSAEGSDVLRFNR
jgi:hypothetical protein